MIYRMIWQQYYLIKKKIKGKNVSRVKYIRVQLNFLCVYFVQQSERNFEKVGNYFPKTDNKRASQRGNWRENSVKEQSNG